MVPWSSTVIGPMLGGVKWSSANGMARLPTTACHLHSSRRALPEKMPNMSVPLIAIPAYRLAPGRVSLWGERPAVALPASYVEAVLRAGGHPILLTSLDPGPAEELLAPFDALLLVGGGDVDPAAYGQERRAELYGVDPDRDRLEMELVRAALRQGKPALCVCRGMQVANVALGGTLLQHLPDLPEMGEHGVPLGGGTVHDARVAEESLLGQVVGGSSVRATCHHHQGIDRLGDGLVASAWSDDGLVEGIELGDRGGGWLVGVQWHPEETAADDPSQQALFEALVARAAARRIPAALGEDSVSR
jgi:putative glutamine amidotransferase